MRNLTLAIVIAIGFVFGNVGQADAAESRVCATRITITGAAGRYGAITGTPATLTYDDCSTARILVHNQGLGDTIALPEGGLTRIEYGIHTLLGYFDVYITGVPGKWTASYR